MWRWGGESLAATWEPKNGDVATRGRGNHAESSFRYYFIYTLLLKSKCFGKRIKIYLRKQTMAYNGAE
jgi:hypothetical protein